MVQDIIRGLYEGRYEPGQRLFEAKLTKTYGISRGPVREALNSLAVMGIVELTLQRGAQVRVLRVDEAVDTLVVAQTLIGLAARLAAHHIERPGAKEKMHNALDALTAFDPANGSAEFAVARDAFYGVLTSIAANPELSRILPTVRIHLIRVQFRSILRADDPSRHADYRRIARAVLAGQPGEAEAAARAHLARAIKGLMSFRGS